MIQDNRNVLIIDKFSHILNRYAIKIVFDRLINRLYLSNENLVRNIMLKSMNNPGVDLECSEYNKATVAYIENSKDFFDKRNLIDFHIGKIESKKEDAEQKIKAYKAWQTSLATSKLTKSMIPLSTLITYKKFVAKKLGNLDVIMYKSKFYALEKSLNKLRNFNISREKENLNGEIAYNKDKFEELEKVYKSKCVSESFITKMNNTLGYNITLNKKKAFYSILNHALKRDNKYSDEKTISRNFFKNLEELF